MVRKIVPKITDAQLQKDLEKYRKLAIELGATDAKIITTDMVVIDERVRAKCLYPKCPSYGTSVNCPPYAIDLDYTRKIVNSFQYSIFFKIDYPVKDLLSYRTEDRGLSPRATAKKNEIVAKIEAEAFYDGYHLALGFGGGSCKELFCPDEECRALIPGMSCRHPLKSRAAMEAVGMDVYLMAVKSGWNIYPIGSLARISDVPHASTLGIILIY